MSTTKTPSARATDTTATAGSATDAGLLLVRVVFGLGLAAHGTQKLFGWFGGGGVAGTSKFFEQAGFTPATPLAVVGGVTELVGGLAVVVGVLTPLACAGIAAAMVGATAVTWAGSGTYFAMTGGVELELLLVVLALGLALTGPGRFSFDHGRPWLDARFRYLMLALGLALGLLALLVRAV